MAVMARERWTDEQIDKAFDRVDADLREIRVEIRRGFDKVDKRFERVDDRFDAMQRNLLICFVTLNATLIGGLIATQL
jgi:hypothetical protein